MGHTKNIVFNYRTKIAICYIYLRSIAKCGTPKIIFWIIEQSYLLHIWEAYLVNEAHQKYCNLIVGQSCYKCCSYVWERSICYLIAEQLTVTLSTWTVPLCTTKPVRSLELLGTCLFKMQDQWHRQENNKCLYQHCINSCMKICMKTCINTCINTCMKIGMNTCMKTCINTYINTCISTCLKKCFNTCINTLLVPIQML